MEFQIAISSFSKNQYKYLFNYRKNSSFMVNKQKYIIVNIFNT